MVKQKSIVLFSLILVITLGTVTQTRAEDFTLDQVKARQIILVVTPDWQTDHGEMYTFVKKDADWSAGPIYGPVTVGKNGLGWGIGLHPNATLAGEPSKKEGDGKAPAGIFKIGSAFGYLEALPFKYPYQHMTEKNYCVDVVGSPYYNQTVSSQDVGTAAVEKSTEPMRRDIHSNGDHRYKKGLFVEHNPNNTNGAGSCIFMHLWKDKGVPTSGCTAMKESQMDGLLSWMSANDVVYVALPQSTYQRLQPIWKLPLVK